MKKATKSKNDTNEISYGLRRKAVQDMTKQNDTKSKRTGTKTSLNVKKASDNLINAKSPPVTRKTNGIIKNNRINETPTKKLTVLSTKIRSQKTKQLTDVSTPKTRQLDQKQYSTRNSKKTNEIDKSATSKQKSAVENVSEVLKKDVNLQGISSMNNVFVQVERLSKRTLKLLTGNKETKMKGTGKKSETKLLVPINSTPQSKNQPATEKKSAKPVRVLRKRNNAIANKYKDITLDSPLHKKPQKPASSNPMAIYEFEYDSSEEPTKKYESDSSGEEDKSMRLLLKKLKKANKKNVKKRVKIQNKVPEIKCNLVADVQKNAEQVNNSPRTKDNLFEEKQLKPVQIVEKQKLEQISVHNKNNLLPEIKTKVPEKQKLEQLPINIVNNLQPEIKSKVPEKQKEVPEIVENLQPFQISINSDVEMVSLSDTSDPLDPISAIDPSIQARNIVEEVTKSFIEDLSDEESNSPGRIKIHSNVLVRNGKPKTNKTKIFNSTTNGLKVSQPWRINVSAIKKKPHFFTYKDKTFTPRYEPDYDYEINENKLNPKDKSDTNQENIKTTYQTSILNFVKGTKPKIIENKIAGLFNDVPKTVVQSPRKVLAEINFVQSTPLKPNTNLNILKSPNISFISPKKKSSDNMFGFSYFSDDDENKENNIRRSPRKSPKKIKPKTTNLVNEIAKQPKVNTNQENMDNALKEENLTVQEPEITAASIDSDISIGLFQDIDNKLDVKKTTRKYVRKHPKRKRLRSATTDPSDDESESELITKKKKQKQVRTIAEEEEADRLASFYNSMFEEIEKYPLLFE